MSKIFCFGDSHYRERGSFTPFHIIEPNGLTKEMNNSITGCSFVADKIKETKPDAVIHLGDSYHIQEFVPVSVIWGSNVGESLIWDACKELEIPYYRILGNHDLWSENQMINSITGLARYGKIILNPEIIDVGNIKVGLLPFRSSYAWNLSNIQSMEKSTSLICCHNEFVGARYNSGKEVEEGLSPNIKVPVISGHMHLTQKIGNVFFPGSVILNMFVTDDEDRIGGVCVFDSETKQIQRYTNNYSRHYLKTTIDKIKFLDPNRYVLQLLIDSDVDIEQLREELPEYMFTPIYKSSSNVNSKMRESYSGFETTDPKTILKNFVSKDRPEVISVIERLFTA